MSPGDDEGRARARFARRRGADAGVLDVIDLFDEVSTPHESYDPV